MSITLKLSPEIEAQLRELATERGVEIEALAGEAVSLFALNPPPTDPAALLLARLQKAHQHFDEAGFAGISGETELRSVRDDA